MNEVERLKLENEMLRNGLNYYADPDNQEGYHGVFWKLVANKGQMARLHLLAADMIKSGEKNVDIRKIRCD